MPLFYFFAKVAKTKPNFQFDRTLLILIKIAVNNFNYPLTRMGLGYSYFWLINGWFP